VAQLAVTLPTSPGSRESRLPIMMPAAGRGLLDFWGTPAAGGKNRRMCAIINGLRKNELTAAARKGEQGAVSYLITPFEVTSKVLSQPVICRFVHLYAAIATRHSDTMDCVFRVNGRKATVAISCAGLKRLADQRQRSLSDQQLAEIAALYLRRVLEQGYDATEAELFVGEEQLQLLASELGFL